MANTDNPDRGAFIWYELMTPDAAGARAFYKEVVGWDIAAENSMPGGDMDYRMIMRSDGGMAGGMLAMSEEMQANGAPPCWLGYVHHPDVDGAVKAIEEAGGAVHMAPHDMEGVGRMAMVADPQGAMIYVMKPAPPAGAPDAQSDVFDDARAQHMRWNELQTTDQDAAIELYCDLFGWEQEGGMPMGELGEYKFIRREGGMIGAIMPKMAELPRSMWSFYAGVEDIDRAAKAITDNGGKLFGKPQEIPGGEFSINAIDPQGAAIGFVGPRKS